MTDKKEEIYKAAFELLLADFSEKVESRYCHWNCHSGRDCDGCEHQLKRKPEYWIKQARKRLREAAAIKLK